MPAPKTVAPPTRASIGLRLRAARESAGLTQVQLGERLDLPQYVVSVYERGGRMPRVDFVWRWAKACGVRLEECVG